VRGLRLDAGGRERDEQTINNLTRLIGAGIKLGGITVLTKRNVHHIRQIYGFWRSRGLPFRLLPVHRGPGPDADGLALSPQQVARAFAQCADLWLSDPYAPPQIAPLHGFMLGILRSHAGAAPLAPYDKSKGESVFIVNTDGSVGGIDDLLEMEHAYGNIFESSLAQLSSSEGHVRAAAKSTDRMLQTCRSCPFFGKACSGQPVASGGKDYGDEQASCVARKTIAHLQRRFVDGGLIDPVTGALAAQPSKRTTAATEQAIS
jgi:uncharacterized protein